MKNTILGIMTLLTINACKSNITTLQTEKVYKTEQFGFTQASITNGFLFTSGQVGWDTNYMLTGNKDFKEQLKQTFINLDNILKEGKGSFDNIVLLRFYVKDLNDSKRDEIGLIMKTYFLNRSIHH